MSFHCIFTFLFPILLLLSMIQTRHAWPLMNSKGSTSITFDSNNDNIVIVIPKPDVTNENGVKPHLKFHTVSCFQDILEEEEEDEDVEDDPLMIFYDEYDYTDEEEEDYDVNNAFSGFFDLFNVMKDTLNSVWNFPWSFVSWDSSQSIKEKEMDLRFHLHFDV